MKYLIVFFSLLYFACSHAEIFKWVDANGRTHFGDKPPHNEKTEEITVQVNTYTSVSYDMSVFDTGSELQIFTKDDCGYCAKAKDYMDSQGVTYRERNIDHSRSAKIQHKKMKATGVPVFIKGKQRMNGYSQDRLDRFIAQE